MAARYKEKKMFDSEVIEETEQLDLRSVRNNSTVEGMAIELDLLANVTETAGQHAAEILEFPVIFNSRFKRKYGRFDGRKKIVELATWLNNDAEQLRDTFLHEVAHAICCTGGVCERPHGRTWKKYAEALGAVPETFCDVDVEGQAPHRPRKPRKKRAVGRCESCNFVFYRTGALPAGERECLCRDEDELVCHGKIRKYKTRTKRQP
jgi:predicted SprT family Zn-dependent metalloprotease